MASLQLLAIKPKTWRDLVSDEPFTREDIVTIQVSRVVFLVFMVVQPYSYTAWRDEVD